jgi:outer membrane protein assembly factor BamD (BamD/ComL family)
MTRPSTKPLAAAWIALFLLLTAACAASGQERIWTGSDWAPAPEPKKGTPEGEVALVRNHIREGDWDDAVDAAEDMLEDYPTSPYAEEALYLAGLAEMKDDDYIDAHDFFKRQVSQFPGGEYFEQAMRREYEIGDAFVSGRKRPFLWVFRVDATGTGLDILASVAELAPGSGLAEKALLRIGDYHYNEQEWASAIAAYDNFVRLFGKTAPKTAQQASYRAARASFSMFQGVHNEDTPLLEARQRFVNFAEQYPQAAEEYDVAGTIAVIDDIRAEKLWTIAGFYRRTDRPDSAAFYAKLVVREFPDTTWATRSEQMLEDLGVQPAPAEAPAPGEDEGAQP